MARVGKGSFIVGLVIAAAGGIGFEQAWFGWVFAVLGLIVGFLNISDKESQPFLLAAIAHLGARNSLLLGLFARPLAVSAGTAA